MTFACHPDYTHPFSGFTWHASPMGNGELICFAAEAQIRFCMEGFYSWASLDKDMKGRGYLSWPLICKGVLQLLWLKYMLVADIPGVCANPDLSCHLFPTAHCYIKCTYAQDWTVFLYWLFEKQVTCHLAAQFSDTALLWWSFLIPALCKSLSIDVLACDRMIWCEKDDTASLKEILANDAKVNS